MQLLEHNIIVCFGFGSSNLQRIKRFFLDFFKIWLSNIQVIKYESRQIPWNPINRVPPREIRQTLFREQIPQRRKYFNNFLIKSTFIFILYYILWPLINLRKTIIPLIPSDWSPMIMAHYQHFNNTLQMRKTLLQPP